MPNDTSQIVERLRAWCDGYESDAAEVLGSLNRSEELGLFRAAADTIESLEEEPVCPGAEKCGAAQEEGAPECLNCPDHQPEACKTCGGSREVGTGKTFFDRLLSAAKQWRNATESRLKLLDSRGEAAKAMLKADRDFIAVIEEVGGE